MKPLDAAGPSAGLDTMAEDLDQLKYDVGELKDAMRMLGMHPKRRFLLLVVPFHSSADSQPGPHRSGGILPETGAACQAVAARCVVVQRPAPEPTQSRWRMGVH